MFYNKASSLLGQVYCIICMIISLLVKFISLFFQLRSYGCSKVPYCSMRLTHVVNDHPSHLQCTYSSLFELSKACMRMVRRRWYSDDNSVDEPDWVLDGVDLLVFPPRNWWPELPQFNPCIEILEDWINMISLSGFRLFMVRLVIHLVLMKLLCIF